MASISGSSEQSFVRVRVNSLNSPASTVTFDALGFRPGLEAQRRLKALATVGTENVEIIVELQDEVFEAEDIRGRRKGAR